MEGLLNRFQAKKNLTKFKNISLVIFLFSCFSFLLINKVEKVVRSFLLNDRNCVTSKNHKKDDLNKNNDEYRSSWRRLLFFVIYLLLIKTLVLDDSHDRTPKCCHSTWWPHLRDLWILNHQNPRNRKSLRNCHQDWKSVCDCCQNRRQIYNLDRPLQRLCNK